MQDRKTDGPRWLVSVRMVMSIAASVVAIMGALIGTCAWCIGAYQSINNRVTVLETNGQYMRDDLKEIKGMLSQLMMNTAGNRPDTQRWSK